MINLGAIRVIRLMLVLCITLQACDSRAESYQDKAVSLKHVSMIIMPEPVTFLRKTAIIFDEYKQKFGVYPRTWNQLPSFSFACAENNVGDKGTFPEVDNHSHWQPADCRHTYVIEYVTMVKYKIVAVNANQESEYEITEAMEAPLRLEQL